jgi:hypothetical protein
MAEISWTSAFRRLAKIPRANVVNWSYSSHRANSWFAHIGWQDYFGFIGLGAYHPDPLLALLGAISWAERECGLICLKCGERRASCCPPLLCCECKPNGSL